MTRDAIDSLIGAGDYAAAAALAEQEQRWTDAATYYEKVWDFAAACRVSQLAADLPRALTNALRGRDLDNAAEILASSRRRSAETMLACAEICEQRGITLAAAELRQELGDDEQAAALFEASGEPTRAAELYEKIGRVGRAIELYEAACRQARGDGVIVAQLALAKLLLRHGRFSEAVPLFQQSGDALGAAVALHRAGYRRAAALALDQGADNPPAIDDLLTDPRYATVESGDDHTVLAGRYRLGDLLGSGGMGRVYAARDLLAGKDVAVKVFTAPGGARGRDAYKRFAREALSTGQLDHPHIVRLLDFNEDMGFMVLEYMAGGTLRERLRPMLPLATARTITLQLIDALAAAHQRGIIHRDIKPSNVFFTAAGAAKLGDFGVAHLQDSGQTQTGAFIGTLAYMSPEQIKGERITFAADIYALGVTLFHMLTGRLPFEPPDLVGQHLLAPPPAPSSLDPALPAICDDCIARCLAKAPAERFESLAALKRTVGAFPSEPDRQRPISMPSEGSPRDRRSGDHRYTIETLRFINPALELREARDGELDRPVLLVRLAPGEHHAALAQLLRAAARGDERLQRVLSLENNNAVLAPLMGAPVDPHLLAGLAPPTPSSTVTKRATCEVSGQHLLREIAAALLPLHAAGIGHGALRPSAIVIVANESQRSVQLSVADALVEHSQRLERGTARPSPLDDIQALAEITCTAFPAAINDAATLSSFLAEQRHAQRATAIDRVIDGLVGQGQVRAAQGDT